MTVKRLVSSNSIMWIFIVRIFAVIWISKLKLSKFIMGTFIRIIFFINLIFCFEIPSLNLMRILKAGLKYKNIKDFTQGLLNISKDPKCSNIFDKEF